MLAEILDKKKNIVSKEWEASITIFAALIFTVILSLVLFIVEGARQNAIRMKIECAMELSMLSCFAEYNRELLEQYDLLFIDATYGRQSAGVGNVEEHLKRYMNDNFLMNEIAGVKKDLLALYTEDVKVDHYALATDEGGEIYKRQAVSYMKDRYGLGMVHELKEQIDSAQSSGIFTRDVTSERNANQSQIDNFEIPDKQVSEDEWEEVELNNPADAVNATRGILTLVLSAEDELSTAGVNLSNYYSNRKVNQGEGLLGRKGCNTTTDSLLFHEYLIDKAGNYTSPKKEGQLWYQLEYMLSGKDNDVDNLKDVVGRLLLLRETSNVIYLFSDSAKMAEAEAMAATVTSLIGIPALTELVKISLIFAWGYAEAVYDVRTLLGGGRIPLMKTQTTWHYSLESMLQFAGDSVQQEASSQQKGEKANGTLAEGFCYEDYLRVFMTLEKEETLISRSIDIIEMDIQKTDGNQYFRMDACMDYIEATVYTASKYGYSNEITRKFYYY